MIKHQDNTVSSDDHDELINLIPGYVKGKLTAGENAAVKQHLSDCNICRQEVLNCQALANSLPVSTESWKPSAAHFAGILAGVDKLEAAEKLKQSANTVPKAGFFQWIRQLFAQTPRPVRWTLAAESLAFAMLVTFVVLPGVSNLKKDQTGAFETLSTAETTAFSSGQMLRVVFSDTMTAKELSDLLLQTKAQIRQGPSEVGAYTIELPSGDAVQTQAALRAHPKVKLVLPIAANAPKP
jgi:Putative zinc-finger